MADKLEEIFALQTTLNDRIFAKNGLTDKTGKTLSTQAITSEEGPYGPNSLTNEWLSKLLCALREESVELNDELLWKWWSKDTLDIQNIRVEIVDLMHFLTSLAIVSGMDANMFHRLYTAKHAVNEQRQDNNYSKLTKDEKDNKAIV